LPVLLAGEPVAFPLRELPAPTKAAGNWMTVSDWKVIDEKKVPLTLVRLQGTAGDTEGYENRRIIYQKVD
jgi:hypothetical protein